jgi:pimeloyl-ACP methyl ester carboxylesterase
LAPSLLDHWLLASRLFFPRKDPIPDPFLVTAADGETQLACFHASPHPGAPTFLHFHGNGEVVADYLPDMADEFTRIGVNVLFAEYRGYGMSTGSPALGAMLDDAACVLAALGGSPTDVILFGRSLGSLFAIDLASKHPDVRGLVLESGIADPLDTVLSRVTPAELGVSRSELAATVADRLDHQAKLGSYAGPLLVLHAANDRLVLRSHAERNFAWAATPAAEKELVLFPRGNHNTIFLSNYEEYTEALRRFLARSGSG